VTTTKKPAQPSERRADLVRLAADLFAEKGFQATSVREIAKAAGILSGSLYHHFDSKESIGDEILREFIDDVLGAYREAVAGTDSPRVAIERMVRSSTAALSRHRAALTMLQNDWAYINALPRFAYLRTAMREIEQTWIDQLERGKRSGVFRADLDARLIYRLLRDILWIPTSWKQARGKSWSTDEIVNGLLRLLFVGISAP
jgi:AcrR family transcriptional regulator